MAREVERLQRQSGRWVKKIWNRCCKSSQSFARRSKHQRLGFSSQGTGELRLQGLQMTSQQETQFVRSLRAEGYEAQVNSGQWRIVNMPNQRGGA
jgi:hypothetical protein